MYSIWTTIPAMRVNLQFIQKKICKKYKLSIDVWTVRRGKYLAELKIFENLKSVGEKKS